MKKWLVGLMSLTTIALVLSSCAPTETTIEKVTDKATTIRLGVMPSTDNIPFILAHEQGFDHNNGVNIELEVFKSAPDRDAAFQAGKVDGVITDLVGLAIYQQGDFDVKVVAAPYDQFDLVTGDDSVQSVADLKGKDVVFSSKTGTGYAVSKMLESAGLTMADINITEIPQVPTRLELITNQKASAAILPEPFVTIGQANGLRVVQSTRDIGINPFAIAFTSEMIAKEEVAINGLFDAYNEAAIYVEKTPVEDYIDLFIKEVGFPASLKKQIVIPDYGKLEQVKEKDVESAFAWAREAGLLKKELTAKDVISDVYFK